MRIDSPVLKVLIGILAVIGLLAVLGAIGMALMHGGMMGSFGNMAAACQGMMGSVRM